MTEVVEGRASTRAAIIDAAARLLRLVGPAGVTTRGVAEAAGVQAPAIYRLFGDKDGLLEAVAEHVMAGFVADKTDRMAAAADTNTDPVQDLCDSWQQQIDFGLANPGVFRLLSDPDRVLASPAAQAGKEVLATRVRRVAAAGRLRLAEHTAVALIQAAGIGTIQMLLATPVEQRDPALPDTMLDAVLARVLTDPSETPTGTPNDSFITAAISMRASASQLEVLSRSERQLLTEWLDRISAPATDSGR